MLRHQYCKLFASIKSLPQPQLVCFHNISEKQFFISLQLKVDDKNIGSVVYKILVYNSLRRKHHFGGLCIRSWRILAEVGAKEIGKR
jgi:hypothetical protein